MRYHVIEMTETKTGATWGYGGPTSVFDTNDLRKAVECVSNYREDGDGSQVWHIDDKLKDRKVTLGDLKRAGIAA